MSKKSKKQTIFKKVGFYLTLIYSFLTLSFVAQILKVNVIPAKYIIIVIILLFLVMGGLAYLQLGNKINKINKVLGKILLVILSILLIVGNWYLYKTDSAFNKMTNENTKTSVVSVIVLKENSAKNIEDLIGKRFGVNKTGDTASLDNAINSIKKDFNNELKSIEYNSYKEFAEALYEGKVDAIVIDEGSRGLFEDFHPTFEKDTRIIKSFEYKSDTKDISKNVNVTDESFNMYITGIDTFGSITSVSRSDVNMIATINPKTHQILLTSIPRDYYIPQPCQGGQADKLTHTGIFGVECTIGSVENYFGIAINYYTRVNFSSLIDIVDAIGGITVESPVAFTALDYSFNVGMNNLNGKQALAFSRERYNLSDGDRDRGKNQMRVITGIINKMISPSIITKYASIMDAVGGSFQTNMTTSEMTSLIKMQINDMSGWDIEQIAVNGKGNPSAWSPANGSNAWVMEPDKKTVENAVILMKKVQAGEDVKPLVEAANAENSAAE